MKTGKLCLAKEALLIEKEWQAEGITVLRAKICLPQSEGKSRAARRFNRYYHTYAQAYLRYCEMELLPRSALRMRSAMECSRPWEIAHAELTYTVALEREDIISIYTDVTETGIGLCIRLRRADTWGTEDGLPLPLESFFPAACRVKRLLLSAARQEILEQIENGYAFYPRWRRSLRRYYSARRFYLTPEGLVWFYPPCTLAPAKDGVKHFKLPYSEAGPFLPPLP